MALQLELWKKKRKELNLKYEDLAQKAQVSLNTVKNIFRGSTTDPRLETVQAIENALGLKQPLVSESESVVSQPLSEKEQELLTAFRALNTSLQDNVIQIVKAIPNKGV